MPTLADFQSAKVLLRADLNVPVRDGVVTDMSRIMASIPTIQQLLQQGCAVVVCSHLGRPASAADTQYSLQPVANALAKALARPVDFVDDCTATKNPHLGSVTLLENTRFYPEEKANDAAFAQKLAAGCDGFVLDAFGTAHRAHASTVGVTEYLPSCAGLLLERELEVLQGVIAAPEKPLTVLVGGAKLETKIAVLKKLATIANTLLLGGGIANTFLAHRDGVVMGASLWEPEAKEIVAEVLTIAEQNNCQILLPRDGAVAAEISADAVTQTKDFATDQIAETDRILDLGPASIADYSAAISTSQTFVWNGPTGIFEYPPFAAGTTAIAQTAAALQAADKKAILGGGDTLAAVGKNNLQKSDFFHLSTGGGAMLELLEGKELPAVIALG